MAACSPANDGKFRCQKREMKKKEWRGEGKRCRAGKAGRECCQGFTCSTGRCFEN